MRYTWTCDGGLWHYEMLNCGHGILFNIIDKKNCLILGMLGLIYFLRNDILSVSAGLCKINNFS